MYLGQVGAAVGASTQSLSEDTAVFTYSHSISSRQSSIGDLPRINLFQDGYPLRLFVTFAVPVMEATNGTNGFKHYREFATVEEQQSEEPYESTAQIIHDSSRGQEE